jgi:hypothetical protein
MFAKDKRSSLFVRNVSGDLKSLIRLVPAVNVELGVWVLSVVAEMIDKDLKN